jgi:hypothetical protein
MSPLEVVHEFFCGEGSNRERGSAPEILVSLKLCAECGTLDLGSGPEDFVVSADPGIFVSSRCLLGLGLLVGFVCCGTSALIRDLIRSSLAILAATSAAVNVEPLDGADLVIGPLRYGAKPKVPSVIVSAH